MTFQNGFMEWDFQARYAYWDELQTEIRGILLKMHTEKNFIYTHSAKTDSRNCLEGVHSAVTVLLTCGRLFRITRRVYFRKSPLISKHVRIFRIEIVIHFNSNFIVFWVLRRRKHTSHQCLIRRKVLSERVNARIPTMLIFYFWSSL
jgi:hypothetical protein